ncbi:hypothetical protein GGS21DRAFT_524503 [Xylaria nigripes]|nr:hypothetical protein GGS21DRAFT_524503 [Xylaria nigripes]
MAPQSDHSSNSYSDSFSASTYPISEPGLPELDPDLSTTDDHTSDDLSTGTQSVLGPLVDQDDGYGLNSYDTASIYTSSNYPTVSITYRSAARSWDDEETIDSTRSVTELDLNYAMENGRRYCGSYYMPNDEDEQVRLQLLNQVYLKALDGELTTVPLENPTHILDIGTAAGEWAIDMAESYPDCEITGTDISNIFERRVPQNVYWEIDDAELEWERPPNYYDLVHLRDMTGAFSDWEAIYRSAFSCLKPGGWLEVLDIDDIKGLHDLFSYFEPESLLYRLVQDVQEASVLSGRPRGVAHMEPRLLVNAGYIDVNLTEYSIPLKTQDGSTGKFWLLSCLNGLEPACMRLLTKYKGWNADDVRLGCEMIGDEMMTLAQDPRRAKTFVVKLRVLTGRKPDHHYYSTAVQRERGGTITFNENSFHTESELDHSLTGRKTATTGTDDSNYPITDEVQRRPTIVAIHETAPTPPSVDEDEHVLPACTRPTSGQITEDWLRNVDRSSSDVDYTDSTDIKTDDIHLEEHETGDIQATTRNRESH